MNTIIIVIKFIIIIPIGEKSFSLKNSFIYIENDWVALFLKFSELNIPKK